MTAIISTKEWGSRPVDNSSLPLSTASGVIIHHTATPNRPAYPGDPAFEMDKGSQLARQIQRDHIARGYRDAGQHFLVTRGGLILEGRQGTLAAAEKGLVIQGAHCGNDVGNRSWWGIECEGMYTAELPPAELWEALVSLCAWLSVVGGTQASNITPHRAWKSTECPGTLFAAQIARLRDEVRRRKLREIGALPPQS